MGRFFRAVFIMIAFGALHAPVLGASVSLEKAIMRDDVSGVRDLLNKNPEMLNAKISNPTYKNMSGIELAVAECCGNNRRDKIVEEFVNRGANINAEINYPVVQGFGTEKGTLLDFVREHINNDSVCTSKNEQGRSRGYDKPCKNIEKLLIEKGVKTYAELHGDATESAKTEITPKDNEPAKTESAPVTQESTNVATVAPTESENTNTEQKSNSTEQLKSDDKKVETKKSESLKSEDTRNVVARGASTARTGTIRVSGIVLGEDGLGLPGATVFFVDENGDKLSGTSGRVHPTDIDGKFEFNGNNIPIGSKLKIGFSTYKSVVVDCGENLTINLEPEQRQVVENMDEVKVVDSACNDDFLERLHAKSGRKKTAQKPGLPCVPTECIDGYRLENGGTDDAVCVEICSKDVLVGLHALNGRPENNQCVPTGCVGNYQITKDTCCLPCQNNTNANCSLMINQSGCVYETACKTGYEKIVNNGKYNANCTNAQTYQITLSWDDGVGGVQSKAFNYAYDAGITIKETPTGVADGFRFLGWCENSADCNSPQSKIEIAPGTSGEKTYYAKFARECSATELNNLHATSGNWIENQCVPTDCVNGYDLDSGVCVEICDANARESLNAKSVTVRGKICVPTKCIDEYKFDDAKNPTKCIWMCDDVDKTKLHAKTLVLRDGKCVPSECESDEFILRRDVCVDKKLQEQVKGAEEEYASARENEMSLKNRLMSGATIGATGIGGMQLASGIAEQSADADAAADMAAYTQKMQCRVGGRRYNFNEKSVNVGGENSLTGLYSEYVALADDMARRRTELEQSPGIESAIVFKREYTGLYDDVGTGVQNGTYASLYRASIGNEKDASRIADDVAKSETRIKTSAVVAGVGVAGGTIGNVLINSNDDTKNEDENSKANKSGINLEQVGSAAGYVLRTRR